MQQLGLQCRATVCIFQSGFRLAIVQFGGQETDYVRRLIDFQNLCHLRQMNIFLHIIDTFIPACNIMHVQLHFN